MYGPKGTGQKFCVEPFRILGLDRETAQGSSHQFLTPPAWLGFDERGSLSDPGDSRGQRIS